MSNPPASTGSAEPDYHDRVAAAPEAMRSRALGLAGLHITAVGALTAGIIYTGHVFTVITDILAFAVLLALCLCVVAYGSAGQKYMKENIRSSGAKDEIPKLIDSIVWRLQVGQISSLCTLGLALALVASILFIPASTEHVQVELKAGAQLALRRTCPNIGTRVSAQIAATSLSSDSKLIRLDIDKSQCGGRIVTVEVPRDDVRMITVATS
jgi:hypothetical protein